MNKAKIKLGELLYTLSSRSGIAYNIARTSMDIVEWGGLFHVKET
ncbi:hypothetical protein JOC34_003561 [Virgibacillus halotolerans]|nr:hypothetical protein [Virgibacillus halotolerans]MBM7601140.1 hypothetical protein [Virgibacillus halotolerans]